MQTATVSEFGTESLQNKSTNSFEVIAFHQIKVPFKVINYFRRFNGEIWRSDFRILISIPSEAWIEYGTGFMDLESQHNFEQIAWIQLTQYHAKDLNNAIKQATFYSELSLHARDIRQYQNQNIHKLNYINLVYQTKVYQILEKWIESEAERAQFYETHRPVTLDNQDECHPSPFDSVKYFNEEWDNISISSSYGSSPVES